jgi:lysophospholipase L1-like esterase
MKSIKHTFRWVSNVNGSVTINSSVPISGDILRVDIIPSTQDAPTNLYDVTLTDSDGVDVLAGQGADSSETATETVCVGVPLKDGTTTKTIPVVVDGTLTLNVTNAGDTKSGRVVVYYTGSGANATSGLFKRFVSCDGDSLTEGVAPGTAWPTLLATGLGAEYRVRNIAIGGQAIIDIPGSSGYLNSDVATQVDPYSVRGRLADKQHIVVVWAGTNDIFHGSSGAQAHSDFAAYCRARQVAGAKVIAINMIARTTADGFWTIADKNIFNSLFAADAASYSDARIDAAATFSDITNMLLYNADQVHITTAGGQIIADAVRAIIEAGI